MLSAARQQPGSNKYGAIGAGNRTAVGDPGLFSEACASTEIKSFTRRPPDALSQPLLVRLRDAATQIEGGCRTIDWWQFAHEPGHIVGGDVPDSRDVVRFDENRPNELFAERSVPAGAAVSDLGWELYAQGLGALLRRLAKRGKPLWVTENGIADAADTRRTPFIVAHLAEVARAIADGIDVRGYLHWSLLDNFEWAEGYAARFGLYAVDYATQTRTLRASGEAYAQIAKSRRLE